MTIYVIDIVRLKIILKHSPQAWGYARVHSFVVKGKTYYTADADLR
jgi:hypothetical protein